MIFKKIEAKWKGNFFIIEEDFPEVGAYLYVLKEGLCVADYLQDDIETCKSQALDDYGVPFDSWEEADTKDEPDGTAHTT